MLGRGVTTCTAAATAGNVKMRFTPAVKQNITKLLDIKVFLKRCPHVEVDEFKDIFMI